MKHNLPMASLFGLTGVIGVIVMRVGIKQKKQGDIMIGALITVGSLLIYFLDFF
jgi:hypothetical protein